jgi:uncharacterized protein (TIGR03435 family)
LRKASLVGCAKISSNVGIQAAFLVFGVLIPARGDRLGILLQGAWHFAARKQTVGGARSLVSLLSEQLGRPVVDKTGLTGDYDWVLVFRDERPGRISPPGTDAPTISVAVEERLGLKLESKKGPVEVLVVDSGNKTPADN